MHPIKTIPDKFSHTSRSRNRSTGTNVQARMILCNPATIMQEAAKMSATSVLGPKFIGQAITSDLHKTSMMLCHARRGAMDFCQHSLHVAHCTSRGTLSNPESMVIRAQGSVRTCTTHQLHKTSERGFKDRHSSAQLHKAKLNRAAIFERRSESRNHRAWPDCATAEQAVAESDKHTSISGSLPVILELASPSTTILLTCIHDIDAIFILYYILHTHIYIYTVSYVRY